MTNMMLDDLYPSMPWAQIDNVVFDVGNVLLRFDPQTFLDELTPDDPQLRRDLLLRVFRSPYWVMMDHGLATCETAGDMMCHGHPELAPYVRRLMSGWVEMRHVVQEGLDTLEMCKRMGKRVYILSNYGSDSFARVEAKYAFLNEVDGKLVSSRDQLVKPDPAIYRLMTDRFSLVPARTLFIDDAPANIEMALFCGWQGICYNEEGKLYRFFGT